MENPRVYLAGKLKEAKDAAGITQRALAFQIGIGLTALSRYMHVTEAPSRAHVEKIDGFLKLGGALVAAFNRREVCVEDESLNRWIMRRFEARI